MTAPFDIDLGKAPVEMLFQRIARVVLDNPEHPAIQLADRIITYGELLERTLALTDALNRQGVSKGDIVALVLPNSLEFAVSHLALLNLGAITVPIQPEQPPADILARLAGVSPRVLIAASASARILADLLASMSAKLAFGDSVPEGWRHIDDLAATSERGLGLVAESDDSAAVVFTSGVTGAPRAVELTHGSFAHQAQQLGGTLRIRTTDRIVVAGTWTGIFGLTLGLHLPLAHGATVQVPEGVNGTNWPAFLRDRASTVFVGSPQVFSQAVDPANPATAERSSLRYLVCCNGRLAPDLLTRLEAHWKLPVVTGYGLTETCGLISLRLYPLEDREDSVGEPMSDTEVAILNEQGGRLGADRTGRIAVSAPSLMRRYWGEPDRTNDVLRDGWLMTDDMGSLDYNSCLNVQGRSSEMIQKGGFSFFAPEVEEVLRTHPAIREVAVIGVTDPVYGEELKAFVVCNNGTSLAANDVINHAKSALPVYKCPRFIKFCKELPHTPGGKIGRSLLREDRA